MQVIKMVLPLAWFLCSHKYTPCQVPSWGTPFLIGKETDEPKILLLIWDVISSFPSKVWV